MVHQSRRHGTRWDSGGPVDHLTVVEVHTLVREGQALIPLDQAVRQRGGEREIEGAVVLSVNGRALLTESDVTDADPMWICLLNGLVRVKQGLAFRGGFPDVPRDILMEPQPGGRVRIAFEGMVGFRTSTADAADLTRAMVQEAVAFFNWLSGVAVGRGYEADGAEVRFLQGRGPAPRTWTLG